MRVLRYIREWYWFPENKFMVLAVVVTAFAVLLMTGEVVPAS